MRVGPKFQVSFSLRCAAELYPATLFIRLYFLICIVVFYMMTRDPLFLVIFAIVALGFILTLSSYVLDRRKAVS